MFGGNDPRKELERATEELDEEDITALAEMIDESPELLRQTLVEYGYRREGTDTNDGFIINEDKSGLSEAQQALEQALNGRLEQPKTIDEIVEVVGSEGSAFRQQYSSAQYRSWVSEQLKALVEAGDLGRFREGRSIHYTETPELAVRHWARLNERFVDDLSVADASKISDDTGMPASVIREVLRQQ
jgi:hypothetical protein